MPLWGLVANSDGMTRNTIARPATAATIHRTALSCPGPPALPGREPGPPGRGGRGPGGTSDMGPSYARPQRFPGRASASEPVGDGVRGRSPRETAERAPATFGAHSLASLAPFGRVSKVLRPTGTAA